MPTSPPEKGVIWEELFFDLAFVFALTQFSHMLHEDHSWAGIGRVLLLFVTIYWAWAGTTIYTDQRDVGNALDRAGVFALGLGSLLLALTVPGAFGDRGLLFVGVYLAMRVLLAALALRTPGGWRSPVFRPYGSGLVAGPLQLAGGLLHGTTRIVLWSIAVLVDLIGTTISRRTLDKVRVRPLHYTHRYGLLIILVLGESVIQVGMVAVDESLTLARVAAICLSYSLVCALWWAYFIYGVRAFRLAVDRSEQQADIRRSVMVYGHLLFSFAIITVAVGLSEVVTEPLEPLRAGEGTVLFGGAALFLGTFAYTHWRIHRQIARRRIGASVLCLVLMPLAPLVPALAALTTLFAVVAGVSVLEGMIMHRHPLIGERVTVGEIRDDPGHVDEGPVVRE
ncbi:low temperature requirement protein A [Micromonospora sp. PSH03]|uniref:low temperature requirement protein A n=1 Tax=Micromonospora TaxID=1873 RepID=UPI001B35D91A|nr:MULTISPECIES: low temperature requirement protein A [Micromonospora]MBQ0988695.1 low temperature requirement protein A [Micromonospora sp. H61]MCG5454757.1 low temperature requirement protein A [Micromonospora salmantinae]